MEQLYQAIRHVLPKGPVERSLKFVPFVNRSGKEISEILLNFLQTLNTLSVATNRMEAEQLVRKILWAPGSSYIRPCRDIYYSRKALPTLVVYYSNVTNIFTVH